MDMKKEFKEQCLEHCRHQVEVASGTHSQTLRVQGCCSALELAEASPGVTGMLNTRLRPGFKDMKARTKGQHDANWHV